MAWGPRRKLGQQATKSKYSNVKVEIDGHKFASKREAKHYQELKLLLAAGVISDLVLQPRFPMVINGFKVCTYVADFQYVESGTIRVIDVKGWKTDIYILKAKLFKALYPHLTLTEVK